MNHVCFSDLNLTSIQFGSSFWIFTVTSNHDSLTRIDKRAHEEAWCPCAIETNGLNNFTRRFVVFIAYHENFLCWLNGCGENIRRWTSFSRACLWQEKRTTRRDNGVKYYRICRYASCWLMGMSLWSNQTSLFLYRNIQTRIHKDIHYNTDQGHFSSWVIWSLLHSEMQVVAICSRRCNQSILFLLQPHNSQIPLVNPRDKLNWIEATLFTE